MRFGGTDDESGPDYEMFLCYISWFSRTLAKVSKIQIFMGCNMCIFFSDVTAMVGETKKGIWFLHDSLNGCGQKAWVQKQIDEPGDFQRIRLGLQLRFYNCVSFDKLS